MVKPNNRSNKSARNSSSHGGSVFTVCVTFLLGIVLGRFSTGPQLLQRNMSLDCHEATVDAAPVVTSADTPFEVIPPAPEPETPKPDIAAAAAADVPEAKADAIVDDSSPLNDPVKDFRIVAQKFGTDKMTGPRKFKACQEDPTKCERPGAAKPQCRIVGHFYGDLYQRWLAELSRDNAEPFQFLEIGLGTGASVPTWAEYLPRAERHYMDVACGPERRHQVSARHAALYQSLEDMDRLHCGSSDNFDFLHETYKTMRRPDAPPLRVVVEDASHIARHMAAAIFFWIPRLEPGGLLFVEDIEPNVSKRLGGHKIQTALVPQIVHDIHYCGDEEKQEPPPCFEHLSNLIKSVHCDLHICVFERTMDVPAFDPPRELSVAPPNALDLEACLTKRPAT